VEGLLTLKHLHADGDLTATEFAQAKASLLGSTLESPTARGAISSVISSSIDDDIIATDLDYTVGTHTSANTSTDVTTLDTSSKRLRLRRELDAMTVAALRIRAECCGVIPLAIERAKDRPTLANLIVLKAEALRSELGHLTVIELLQRGKQLGVSEDDVAEVAESAITKDALVELIIRADQRAHRHPPNRPQHIQGPASTLDQILVGLQDAQLDVNQQSMETTALVATVDAPRATIQTGKIAVVPSSKVVPDDEVRELEKQLAEMQHAKELAVRKTELLHRIAAAEADVASIPASAIVDKDHGLISLPPIAQPRSPTMDDAVHEPMSEADDEEARAVLKVQAMWRGKTGQKKAVEQEEKSIADS
jgi:hypothetical protein